MEDETLIEAEYEDPVPMYANSVRFEMTLWDLRLFFGQLLPQNAPTAPDVSWHTDITVPWVQAKLMHFFLGVNLAIHEAENGRIKIPATALPPAVASPPPEVDANNAQAMAMFQLVQKLIADFREAEGKG
jgi:hypothetical protein